MLDPSWLEVAGLVLVLAATFVKVFLRETVAEIHQGVLQYRAESKIDSLWMLLAHHHRKVRPADSKMSGYLNLDGIDGSWEFADGETHAGRQASAFKRVENIGFVIGSLLIVSSRLFPLI